MIASFSIQILTFSIGNFGTRFHTNIERNMLKTLLHQWISSSVTWISLLQP